MGATRADRAYDGPTHDGRRNPIAPFSDQVGESSRPLSAAPRARVGLGSAARMIPYWLLFAVPCAFAMTTAPRFNEVRRFNLPLWVFGLFLVLMIGFRWRVGADWGSEVSYMNRAQYRTFIDAVGLSDPGFGALVWLCSQTPFNAWILNLACGGIFTVGLILFCRNEPHPWLAVTIAIPYLVIVVGMGYNRQSTAIGLMMAASVMLQRNAIIPFYLCMVTASMLHSSAALFMILGLIASKTNRNIYMSIGVAVFGAAFFIYSADKIDDYLNAYVYQEYLSKGSVIRILMNFFPSIIFLAKLDRFRLTSDQAAYGLALACISFVFFICNLIFPSATWVDRMALYAIPIQIFVLGRLPAAMARSWSEYRLWSAGIAAYSVIIMLFWLNFADTASEWVPYETYPVHQLFGRDAGQQK